jgi:LmbE family N-acetylglucosaminyl deacetylase
VTAGSADGLKAGGHSAGGGDLVLAVFAHPDDESLACGGTLARLADAGIHVAVMCASHGERGSHDGTYHNGALAAERARELTEAASALGVHELIVFDFPDGNLRWSHVTGFHAELVTFMRRRRPTAVITFDEDGLYWHPDHIGVHERVLTAARSVGSAAPALYGVTIERGIMDAIVDDARAHGWMPPSQGFWSLPPDAFGKYALPHTITVDVADWVPRKLAAIGAHRTQMGTGHPFAQLSADHARLWLGREFYRRIDPSNGPSLIEQLSQGAFKLATAEATEDA